VRTNLAYNGRQKEPLVGGIKSHPRQGLVIGLQVRERSSRKNEEEETLLLREATRRETSGGVSKQNVKEKRQRETITLI
jgi:hypothetical protein